MTTNISMVHVDIIGWGDDQDHLYVKALNEIELYVIGAADLGLSRKEIEHDLQQKFIGVFDDLTFELVTTHSGEVKAIVSAEALDLV